MAWVAVALNFGAVLTSRLIVREGGDPRLWVVVTMIVSTLATLALPIAFAAFAGRPGSSDFGLRRPPLARAAGVVIALLVVSYGLGVAWAAVLGLDDDASNLVDRLAPGVGTLNAFLVVILVAVASPLAEEFLFRGYFFRAMSNWRGVWPAVVITTVAFTGTHIGWTPVGFLVPVAVFGLGLNLAYLWTGSLYTALAMHALLNSAVAAEVLDGWRVPVAVVLSVAATLAIARLIGILLGDRAPVRS